MPALNGPSPALASIGGGQQVGTGNAEVMLDIQSAPVAKTAAATLTAAELTNGIITFTAGAAANLTLPTVAALETLVSAAKADSCFDFSIIDLGGVGQATVVTNTGWTLVGSMAVTANQGVRFRARKTGASAWTLYRIA